MSYNINPAKSAYKYIRETDGGINEANNICYNICAGFGNGNISPACESNCQQFINNFKAANGKSPCSYQAPRRPPIFNQTPHYFPKLFEQNKNVCLAKRQCVEICHKHASDPQDCVKWCKLDSDAVEQKENYMKSVKATKTCNCGSKCKCNGNCNGNCDCNGFPDYKPYADEHPVAFYTGFSIVAIIMSILIVIFIKGVFEKDEN